MKKLAAVVAASLLTMSTASVAAQAAPSAAALSLKSPAARASAGTAKKSQQVEGATILIALAGIAGAVLFYTEVIDDDDSN